VLVLCWYFWFSSCLCPATLKFNIYGNLLFFQKKRLQQEEAEKKKKQMTLTKFIDQYIKDVKDGTHTTLAHGRTFVQGSRFSLTNSLGHFKEFMKDTVMYLDGIAIYDIMKVTGHKSVTTLEKYIRADKLEVAQKLVLQYDYFK